MTVITTPTVRERVSYGAVVLDEHVPGWRDAVDPVGLDVSKCGACVLGQLFGSFRKGAVMLYGEEEQYRASVHGFDISLAVADDERSDEEDAAEFAELTDAWRDLLEVPTT